MNLWYGSPHLGSWHRWGGGVLVQEVDLKEGEEGSD